MKRLTKYLGSADLAGEPFRTLGCVWGVTVKLNLVRSPDSYLYSMAVNIANVFLERVKQAQSYLRK